MTPIEPNPELDARISKVIKDALDDLFDEKQSTQRFIDVSRIPLICKSIIDIHANISEIKGMMKDEAAKFVNQDQFYPVKSIVYGLVGLLLTGIIGSLLIIVLK